MNVIDQAESLLDISNCSARADEFRRGAVGILREWAAELMGDCNGQKAIGAMLAEAKQ